MPPVPSSSKTEEGVPKSRQRAIQSCSHCYKYKVKCDRVFPCSNCRRNGRGYDCYQARSIVKGVVVGGAPSTHAEPTLTIDQLHLENANLRRKLAILEAGLAPMRAKPDQPEQQEGGEKGERDWHKFLRISRRIHKLPAISFDPALDEEADLDPLPDKPLPTPISDADLYLLIPLAQSTFLVQSHITYLSFIHAVVVGKDFMEQHERWLSALGEGSMVAGWDWMALYFAMISASLYLLDPQVMMGQGFTIHEIQYLPRRWFDCSIAALKRAEYVINPTLSVLQTICVLPMIGHIVGASDYVRSLLHTGLALAQETNLHLLGPEPTSGPLKAGLLRREIGRRIWGALGIAESFCAAHHDTSSLVYNPSKTSDPMNIDDKDMVDDARDVKPLSVCTDATYLCFMIRLSHLYRHYALTMPRLSRDRERYALVLECDQMLRDMGDDFPQFQREYGNAVKPMQLIGGGEFSYEPWARFMAGNSKSICRIILHRSFFLRAFEDDTYASSRFICVEAAYDLISACKGSAPSVVTRLWNNTSNISMASVILTVEYAKGDKDPSTRRQLRSAVEDTMNILRSNEGSVAATTGLTAIQQALAMLDGEGQVNDAPMFDDDIQLLFESLTNGLI